MKQIQLTIDGSTNRQVKNSKSTAQTLQRILVKVVGTAYAKLKEICSHSFEGVSTGRKCSNRFRSVGAYWDSYYDYREGGRSVRPVR